MSVGNGLDRSVGLKPTSVGVGTVKTVPYTLLLNIADILVTLSVLNEDKSSLLIDEQSSNIFSIEVT